MGVATYQGCGGCCKISTINAGSLAKPENGHCIHIWHNLPFCTRLQLGVSSIGT